MVEQNETNKEKNTTYEIKKNRKEVNNELKKKNRKVKKIIHEIENTLVRKVGKYVTPFLKTMIGAYYGWLHLFIMISSGTILLFDNNIYHLIILLNIVFIDCISCVFIHDCPLTPLENKYLTSCLIDWESFLFSKMNILYKCNHRYEITLEFLTNMLALIYGKINMLILMKLFKFSINL
jgi:hypothetical protein